MDAEWRRRELRFFMLPGANLTLHEELHRELGLSLCIWGNRAGLVSLANTLLWFRFNGFAFAPLAPQLGPYTDLGDLTRTVTQGHSLPLNLSELEYCRPEGTDISFSITDDHTGEQHQGVVKREAPGRFVWRGSDWELCQIAMTIHSTAVREGHEYEYISLNREQGRADAFLHIRMTDVDAWLSPKSADESATTRRLRAGRSPSGGRAGDLLSRALRWVRRRQRVEPA